MEFQLKDIEDDKIINLDKNTLRNPDVTLNEIYTYEIDEKSFNFDEHEWNVSEFKSGKSIMGWVISKDKELAYVVYIYEPNMYSQNSKRGTIQFTGHEEIILLYLDDGEYTHDYTR